MKRWCSLPGVGFILGKPHDRLWVCPPQTALSSTMLALWLLATSGIAIILLPSASAQLLEFKNRTEGTEIPHGDADMQVLGIIASPVTFGPSSTLYANFYLPSGSLAEASVNTTTVDLEAREITPVRNYFMKSKSAPWQIGQWNQFGPWPTADVIDPKGIQPSNLTILAKYSKPDGSLVYMPVTISGENPSNSSNRYTLHFATSLEIHSLNVTITDPNGNIETLPLTQCTAYPTCVLYEADSSHALTLDMSNRASGVYRVHLIGHVPNSTSRPELSIQIFHEMR
jgi:hypothetical protein